MRFGALLESPRARAPGRLADGHAAAPASTHAGVPDEARRVSVGPAEREGERPGERPSYADDGGEATTELRAGALALSEEAAITPPPPSPLAPATTSSPATAASPEHAHAQARLEEIHALANAVVERASFWGNGERGLARLRLGARAARGLEGATVVLEHDDGVVRLRIEGATEAAAEGLRARLRARGIEVA
jgi:hypothetical protein